MSPPGIRAVEASTPSTWSTERRAFPTCAAQACPHTGTQAQGSGVTSRSTLHRHSTMPHLEPGTKACSTLNPAAGLTQRSPATGQSPARVKAVSPLP